MCYVLAGAALAGAMGYGTAAYAGLSTAATVAAVASAAVAGASAGSGVEAAKYNEKVAKLNANELENKANTERKVGAIEAGNKTVETRQRTSRAAAQLGAGGLSLSTGTSADLLAQNEEMGAVDSLTILNNSSRKALGYETKASNLISQAKSATKQAYIRGGTSILGSVASVGMI